MNRLRFYAARLIRDDAALMKMSVTQADLLAPLTGRRVALIGNARALGNHTHGPAIDAADLVIRINRAPMPAANSHGTRTDWLGLATRLSDDDRARIHPGRILWMSPKRKRLDYATATSPGFYLHPLADYHALATTLNAPPTTGAMLIDLLLRSDLRQLSLYGFDFFVSLSLSGRRNADQVPHDFGAESHWVSTLAANDPRLIRN
ncbi:glycosyltransferase family 29 protein [Paracoccus sp. (in: a-proteobacteria)]|uniref:glycosyltransferase family 29 protein n=1 Tax=Paracoccus sp. TaxID=267 RepID=UPI0026DEF47F|nr:glycosyltransferase family 29 protein [Paracoccus sp. (in: a-proteobacteria)]MDO5647703.1 glycosyltransferase family 29 protein [Paracoccus sp. (in: a-proteobacteria)]